MAIELIRNFLNSNKILFHLAKILPDIYSGRTDFNPIAVEIHPTAKCNYRCIHCSYKERNESRASYSENTMKRLKSSLINMGVKAVYFSGGGEPTLFPGLKDYIEELTRANIEVSLITNASCIESAGLIPIADRFNYIAISVPGIDDETFQIITGSNKLGDVLSIPGKIKDYHKDNSPVIGSRIVLTNKNYRCVDDFLRVIREKKFDYALFKIVRDYEDRGQGLSKSEEVYLRELIDSKSEVDENFTNLKHIFDYKNNPDFINHCYTNLYGLIANISTDGGVYPNIVEIDKPEFCIGNINEKPLEEIWNSSRHKEVKELSDRKWLSGECKNCRAMSYNRIINELFSTLPTEWDNFI